MDGVQLIVAQKGPMCNRSTIINDIKEEWALINFLL